MLAITRNAWYKMGLQNARQWQLDSPSPPTPHVCTIAPPGLDCSRPLCEAILGKLKAGIPLNAWYNEECLVKYGCRTLVSGNWIAAPHPLPTHAPSAPRTLDPSTPHPMHRASHCVAPSAHCPMVSARSRVRPLHSNLAPLPPRPPSIYINPSPGNKMSVARLWFFQTSPTHGRLTQN